MFLMIAALLFALARPALVATNYVVDLWGSGSSGFFITCDSSRDKFLKSGTVKLGGCIGPIGLSGSGGTNSYYSLATAGGDKVQLNVFTSASCTGTYVSLGTTTPDKFEGSCKTGSFSLTDSSLSYTTGWKVKIGPDDAAAAPSAATAGIVVGVLVVVLAAVGVAAYMRRAQTAKPLAAPAGESVVVVSAPAYAQQSPMHAFPPMHQSPLHAPPPPPPPPMHARPPPPPMHAPPPADARAPAAAAAADAAQRPRPPARLDAAVGRHADVVRRRNGHVALEAARVLRGCGPMRRR